MSTIREWPKRTRWFVVTQWNMECDYDAIINRKQVKFIHQGLLEHCPTSKTPHYHLIVCYFNPRGTSAKVLKSIGCMWGETHCHVEPMLGHYEEAEAYADKFKDSAVPDQFGGDLPEPLNGGLKNWRPWREFGNKPKQGMRNDLVETKDHILAGNLSVEEIAIEDPHLYHLYGRTLSKIEAIALRKKYRKWMTRGIWRCGESGSGKSHETFADYDPDTHYVKNINDEWWDGYTGQEIVIFNEFNTSIRYSELMDLVDKWPKTVKQRCKEPVPFLAKEVRITSVKTPYQIYGIDEDDYEFNRRFEVKHLVRDQIDTEVHRW